MRTASAVGKTTRRTGVKNMTLLRPVAGRTDDQGNVHGAIMRVALHLFVTRGYFNTTMRDIGREADLSAGAIYYHFDSKESIARALFMDMVDRIGHHFDEIEKSFSTTHDRCRAVVELLFLITDEEPEVMEYMLHTKHVEFLGNGIPVCSSKPFRQMRAMVHKGMKTGEVRPMDPTVAANAVYGGPLRMISMRLDGLVEKKLRCYMDEVWAAAWRSVAV